MIPIVVCTIGSSSFNDFEQSVQRHSPKTPIIVHRNEITNFGDAYNNALNEAFQEYDEVLIANDDIVVQEDTIEKLLEDVEYLKKIYGKKLGLVAIRSNNVRPMQQGEGKIQEASVISPILAWISKEAFFDAQFPPINWYSDDVMCQDLNKKGYKHFISRAYAHHVGSQSIGNNHEEHIELARQWIGQHRPEYEKMWFDMKRILIGTPAHDGKVDVWFANSLVETIKLGIKNNIEFYPLYMSYDSLVQRARNDLVSTAVNNNFDAILWIDADMEWNPQWAIDIVSRQEDVIGLPVIKKSHTKESYNINCELSDFNESFDGLYKVKSVGTGFLKMSKKALTHLWNNSTPYIHNDKECRWIFDVVIEDGDLISEDTLVCNKLRKAGFDIYIDPAKTCNHIGNMKYEGNFYQYISQFLYEEKLNALPDRTPMVFDCTMIHWELDLLEIRMKELWDVVDYFIVTESVCDHRGKKRQLILEKNLERFEWAKEKLIINISDKPDFAQNSWDYEMYQRQESVAAIEKFFTPHPNDLVIISDIDEIPSKQSIEEISQIDGVFTLHMPMFYYYFNLFNNDWYHAKAARFKHVRNPNSLRLAGTTNTTIVKDAGWHFSYLGSPEQIQHKLKTFAHDEFDSKEFTDIKSIKNKIKNKVDLFNRKEKLEYMDPFMLPSYILDNKDRFDQFILKEE
jgi:beta-1,4-mannosyl-glycoprotein beta-1,4-N-acetylglucosaminyltransferase